jgi:hypothetical protein
VCDIDHWMEFITFKRIHSKITIVEMSTMWWCHAMSCHHPWSIIWVCDDMVNTSWPFGYLDEPCLWINEIMPFNGWNEGYVYNFLPSLMEFCSKFIETYIFCSIAFPIHPFWFQLMQHTFKEHLTTLYTHID